MLVSTNDFKNETVLRLQLYNLPANTNFYRILLYHRVSLSLKSRETSLRLTLKYSFFRKLFKRLSRFRKLLLWQFICFIRKLCCLYPSNKSPIIYLPHFTFDSIICFSPLILLTPPSIISSATGNYIRIIKSDFGIIRNIKKRWS